MGGLSKVAGMLTGSTVLNKVGLIDKSTANTINDPADFGGVNAKLTQDTLDAADLKIVKEAEAANLKRVRNTTGGARTIQL